MLAGDRAGAPAVVICTGHGPLRLKTHDDRQTPPSRQKAAGFCAFAGHGAAPILASPAVPTETRWPHARGEAPPARPAVFVGRGLAAPPPARGPPSALA